MVWPRPAPSPPSVLERHRPPHDVCESRIGARCVGCCRQRGPHRRLTHPEHGASSVHLTAGSGVERGPSPGWSSLHLSLPTAVPRQTEQVFWSRVSFEITLRLHPLGQTAHGHGGQTNTSAPLRDGLINNISAGGSGMATPSRLWQDGALQ